MLHMMLEDPPATGTESEFRFIDPGYSYGGSENFSTFGGGSPTITGDRGNVHQYSQHAAASPGYFAGEKPSGRVVWEDHGTTMTRFHPYHPQRSPIYTSAGRTELQPNECVATTLDLGYQIEPMNMNTALARQPMQDTYGERNCNSNNNNTLVANYHFNNQNEKIPVNYSNQVYSSNVVPSHSFVAPVYCGVHTNSSNISSIGRLPNDLIQSRSKNMASSPDSYTNDGGRDTKKKTTKKRKKKGGSEPQRPVSAYALFFRDTQAAIKAENSSATFGEISKIVASMWDSLSEEDKQVYKQKTETAKRDYLKHLAAYRANMISKGASPDAEEEDSQPLSVLREKIVEQQRTTPPSPMLGQSTIDLTTQDGALPPPPRLQLAPGVSGPGNQMPEAHVRLQQLPYMPAPTHISNARMPQQQHRSVSPGSATLTKIIVPGQNGATIHVINKTSASDPRTSVTTLSTISPVTNPIVVRSVNSNAPGPSSSTTSPTALSPIPLRNVLSSQQSPITILPNKPGQIIRLVPSESGGMRFAAVSAEGVKGRILKIDDIVQSAAPNSRQGPPRAQPPQTPILQLLADESQPKGRAEGTENEVDKVDENALMKIPQQSLLPAEELNSVMEKLAPQPNGNQILTSMPRKCVRDGCANQAVSCPYWDNEYCSNECVYSHCRDVFDAWVSTRQVTTSAV